MGTSIYKKKLDALQCAIKFRLDHVNEMIRIYEKEIERLEGRDDRVAIRCHHHGAVTAMKIEKENLEKWIQ